MCVRVLRLQYKYLPRGYVQCNLVLILVVYSEQRQKLFARILSCFYEEPKLCTCFQSSPCTFTSTTASQNLPIEVVLFDLVTFLLVLVRWKRGALNHLFSVLNDDFNVALRMN